MKHIIIYLFSFCVIVLGTACDKDPIANHLAPIVITGDACEVTRLSATVSGSIQQSNANDEYGVIYSTQPSMDNYTKSTIITGETSFKIKLQGLTPGTTYYYSTFADGGFNMIKGDINEFTTRPIIAPVLGNFDVTEENQTSISVRSIITDNGGSEITIGGFCWNEIGNPEPTTKENVITATMYGDTLTAIITNLIPTKEYQIRAYATNSIGVGYSNTFFLKKNDIPSVESPVVVSEDDLELSLSAGIINDGGNKIINGGFCWNEVGNTEPTITDNHIEASLKESKLSAIISGMVAGTEYQIRAYVINNVGIGYSNTIIVRKAVKPTVSLPMVSSESESKVTFSSSVSDGGSKISSMGICWNEKGNDLPTIEDNFKESSSRIGINVSINDFSLDKEYQIRAYAINSIGITYSDCMIYAYEKLYVNLSVAGTLSEYISAKKRIKWLVVSGPINGTDIRLIRELCGGSDIDDFTPDFDMNFDSSGNLLKLDLENAIINEGGTCYLYYHTHTTIGEEPEYYEEFYTKKNQLTSHMFSDCEHLEVIIIPKATKIIEDFCFSSSLKEIHCPNENPPLLNGTSWLSNCKVFVPKGCYDVYKKAEGWKNFTNIIEK